MQDDSRKGSQDDLNEYIRVSSPGLLLIVGALALVLVATVVWGFTGKIPVTTPVTGCVIDADYASIVEGSSGASDGGFQQVWVVCFVDSSKYSAEQITRFGENVTITMPDRSTFKGKIQGMSSNPLSRDEAALFLQDSAWVAERCVTSDYSWGIVLSVSDDISGHLYTTPQVTIVTDEVPPIRFLTR